MVKAKNLGWIFHTDGLDGIPYIQCPYCSRKISGREVKFAPFEMTKCPDCGKDLHFDNVTEDDWDYIDLFYGRE